MGYECRMNILLLALPLVAALLASTGIGANSVDYLEWHLPGSGYEHSAPFGHFRAERGRAGWVTGQNNKTLSFTGELVITGRAGQAFCLCADKVETNAFSQAAVVNSEGAPGIYLLLLIETKAIFNIRNSRPCPAFFSHQYSYSSALHLHSAEPFLITFNAESKKRKKPPGMLLPPAAAHPLSYILSQGRGGSDPGDDHGEYRRPGFGAMPDKTLFDLILLPTFLPASWLDFQPFTGLYHWLTDTASPPALTLLLSFNRQPPVRLHISPEEYTEMAEHLLSPTQLFQWLRPKLNNREQLVLDLLNISSLTQLLPETTINAVRQQLALVLEQPDTSFNLEFELSDLARRLTSADEIEKISQPVFGKVTKSTGYHVSGILSYPVTGGQGGGASAGAAASLKRTTGSNTSSGAGAGAGAGGAGERRSDNEPQPEEVKPGDGKQGASGGVEYTYLYQRGEGRTAHKIRLTLVPNDILKSFECAVCLNICNNPHNTCEKHFFCHDCLKDPEGKLRFSTCPICRSKIITIKENNSKKLLIESQEVYCPCRNKFVRCPDTPKICDVPAHLKVCPHFDTTFVHIGCQTCKSELIEKLKGFSHFLEVSLYELKLSTSSLNNIRPKHFLDLISTGAREYAVTPELLSAYSELMEHCISTHDLASSWLLASMAYHLVPRQKRGIWGKLADSFFVSTILSLKYIDRPGQIYSNMRDRFCELSSNISGYLIPVYLEEIREFLENFNEYIQTDSELNYNHRQQLNPNCITQ